MLLHSPCHPALSLAPLLPGPCGRRAAAGVVGKRSVRVAQARGPLPPGMCRRRCAAPRSRSSVARMRTLRSQASMLSSLAHSLESSRGLCAPNPSALAPPHVQVSGLRFAFDPTCPPGQRVVEGSGEVGGTALQLGERAGQGGAGCAGHAVVAPGRWTVASRPEHSPTSRPLFLLLRPCCRSRVQPGNQKVPCRGAGR